MDFSTRTERLHAGVPEDISRFVAGVDPAWVDEALSACGKASIRNRKLPASKAVWVVIGMALFGDRSIYRVVEHLKLVIQGVIQSSAITRARQRLGVQPLVWLFERVAQVWGTSNEQSWRGYSLYGVDGSHMRVDDSEENNLHFGRPRARASVGYPQLRMVALMNLSSRMLLGAEVGPWNTGEATMAKGLWGKVPGKSITIVDRGFLAYSFMLQFLSKKEDKHFLVRLKSNSRFKTRKILSDGSAIATIEAPSSFRRSNPEAPTQLEVRLIKYHHRGGVESILATSLLSPSAHPSSELIQVYHKRWELEVGFDELKTHMLLRKEALRSRTPDGVYQEFWGILLVYNLLRREMASVAEVKGLTCDRISFTGALLLVQGFFLSALTAKAPSCLPRELAEMENGMGRSMILPPRRNQRRFPRQVKIKTSSYPKARERHVTAAQRAKSPALGPERP